MITERFKKRMDAGKPAFGVSMRFRDPAVYEMIGPDWDFFWIDLQHGTIQAHSIHDIIRACDLSGVTSVVRLPARRPDEIGYVLDADPGGVLVAQTETPEMAVEVVRAAKFPPTGERSYGGRRIIDRNGREYTDQANREQLCLVQIESPGAVERAAEIAAVAGVDGLMLGPDDTQLRLSGNMGLPMFEGKIWSFAEQVARAARDAGKHAFGFGGTTVEQIARSVDAGFDMISLGADAAFLKQRSGDMRSLAEAYDDR